MKVTYDARCLRFDGAPQFLLSGSVHYPRTHPSRWASLFASFRAAGLNAVETYVFWGEHQRSPDPVYDWSGRRDLWGFIAAAGDAGLVVLLRLGPYVCAEAHFGGLPAWLRSVPGVRFRTDNGPFCSAMGDWCRVVVAELRRRRLSAADGGPVVAVQLENEYEMVADAYGPGGERYLDWVGRLGGELNVGVPLLMCLGAPVDGGDGDAPVLSTINAFYGHEHLEAHWRAHPASPALWTEHWTGWYGVYGATAGVGRAGVDLAYGTARFVAAGGGGVNYYMMHGGSNWGRSGMYLATASYDYDAPLDEVGGRGDKFAHLAALHAALTDHFVTPLFLGSDAVAVADMSPLGAGPGVVVYRWTSAASAVAFVCNDGEEVAVAPDAGALGGARLGRLEPRSVVLVDTLDGRVLFDTAVQGGARPVDTDGRGGGLGGNDGGSDGDLGVAVVEASPSLSVRRVRRLVVPPSEWSWRVAVVEAVPRLDALPERAVLQSAPTVADLPANGVGTGAAGVVDLVSMTGDTSDYCWYVQSVPVPAAPAAAQSPASVIATLSVVAADIVHAYVNGTYVGSSPASGVPLWEDRFPNKWNAYDDGRGWPGWTHTISFPLAAAGEPTEAAVEVALLVVSTGMVKGDWQLGGAANMLDERKGVLSRPTLTLGATGATASEAAEGDGGSPVASCAAEAVDPNGAAGWTAVPFLSGEVACVGDAEPHRRRFLGQPLDEAPPPLAPPATLPPGVAALPAVPGHLPTWYTAVVTVPASLDGWFLDLDGLTRGGLFVNGHHLARYWTIGGVRGLNGFLDGSPMGVGRATVAITAGAKGGADGLGDGDSAGTVVPPPTQRFYHVPSWVVADGDDGAVTLRVTILDEGGTVPHKVALYDSAMETVKGVPGT